MTIGGVRCNAAERDAFKNSKGGTALHRSEPALGTLDERLDIIIRRLGGTTSKPKMTHELRMEIARCRMPDVAF